MVLLEAPNKASNKASVSSAAQSCFHQLLQRWEALLRPGRAWHANGTGQPWAHPGPTASLFHTSVTGVCL